MPARQNRHQHRQDRRPRGLLLPTVIGLVVVTTAGVFGWVSAQRAVPEATTKPVSQTISLNPIPEIVVQTIERDPLVLARATKPLAALEAGDRVLYSETGTDRQLCTWDAWGGVIDWSDITCEGESSRVKTGFLSPVEPLDP